MKTMHSPACVGTANLGFLTKNMTKMDSAPFLHLKNLSKVHTHGRFSKHIAFQLHADFSMAGATIVGLLGPNGAGKTTLFELIAGNDMPTSGHVICHGQDIHRVKHGHRRFMVDHHRQPNHVRKFKKQFTPGFLLKPVRSGKPRIHLYDEPDMADWYVGLLFNRFLELKSQGHLVVFCVHPTNTEHLKLIRMVCDEYIFVQDGAFTRFPNFDALLGDPQVKDYFAPVIDRADLSPGSSGDPTR